MGVTIELYLDNLFISMNKALRQFISGAFSVFALDAPAYAGAIVGAQEMAVETPDFEEVEPHMLAQWAFDELVSAETGHRSMLEPLLPRNNDAYTPLDMQIADVITQGYVETARLQKLIDALTDPDAATPENTAPLLNPTPFFYPDAESEFVFVQSLTLTPDIVTDCKIDAPLDIINDNNAVAPIQTIAQDLINLHGLQGNDN